MGENPFGKGKLYWGRPGEPLQELGMPVKCDGLTSLIDEHLKVEQSEPKFKDPDGDGVGSYEIEFSIKVDDSLIELFGDYVQEYMRRLRKIRKALLWAVTHGFIVYIRYPNADGSYGNYVCSRPRQLKVGLNMFGYDCLYEIYNKHGFRIRYIIRKGRVVPADPLMLLRRFGIPNKQKVLRTDNPDPNSWLRSFIEKDYEQEKE